MIKSLKNNVGFSFIELLFTLAILSITFISISFLLVNISRINKMSELQYNATLLAQSYMENIKASDNINVGQTIDIIEDGEIIIDIIEINKYQDKIYKINIEVIINEKVSERLEGYKTILQ